MNKTQNIPVTDELEDDFSDCNYFEDLKASLEEVLAFERGEPNECRVSEREVIEPNYTSQDVVRTRKALNMTQKALALALGVSQRTVEAWETGKNTPSGTAQKLLFLFDHDHSLVNRLVQ